MRPLVMIVAAAMLSSVCFFSTQAPSAPPPNGQNHGSHTHFVPNSQAFWDFSRNGTTNYGPAYRDTDLAATNFLSCTGQYALCFESGPEPLPCKLTSDGRFANCKCVVKTGLNFVLITADPERKNLPGHGRTVWGQRRRMYHD